MRLTSLPHHHARGDSGQLQHDAQSRAVCLAAAGFSPQDINDVAAAIGVIFRLGDQQVMQCQQLIKAAHARAQRLLHHGLNPEERLPLIGREGSSECGIVARAPEPHIVAVLQRECHQSILPVRY